MLYRTFGIGRPSPAARITAFALEWLILAVAVWIAASLIPGIHYRGSASVAWVALALGLLNVLVKPLLRFIDIPLAILTLGLFALVFNAVLLWLASSIARNLANADFHIDNVPSAVLGALVIAVVSAIEGFFLHPRSIARGLSL